MTRRRVQQLKRPPRGLGTLTAAVLLALIPGVVYAQPNDPSSSDDQAAPAADPPAEPDADAPPAHAADQDTEGRGAADLIGQATELASARRLRDELDVLLTPEGLPVYTPDGSSMTRLAALATRCELLGNSAAYDTSRLILLRCQARVFNALARQAVIDGDKLALIRRLRQLRLAAQQMRTLESDQADADAAYWLLMADLFDVGRADADPVTQMRQAEQLLGDYIQVNAGRGAAADYLIDARLSLATLQDERGDQAGVADQLERIGPLDEVDPRLPAVEQLRLSVARLGTELELEGVTAGVDLWRLLDHRGKPVLLHIYADPVPESVAMIDGIRQRIAARSLGGFAILSLRVGEPKPGSRHAPWPTLNIAAEPDGVLDRLGIDALPALVWVDAQGRVASIGHTLEVLDQKPVEPPADLQPAGALGPGSDDEPGADQQVPPADETVGDAPAEGVGGP